MSALAEAGSVPPAEAGLSSDVTLVPLRSVTNEVWVAGEHIVRLNRRGPTALGAGAARPVPPPGARLPADRALRRRSAPTT